MAVTVEQYNPEWPQHFQQVKAKLKKHLEGVTYLSIEHVGSTSVPGLPAKPIIDIDIIVTRDNVQAATDALVTNGNFHYLGELGIVDRHVVKDPNQDPKRNIYVCVEGVPQTRNHLGLRNTLRTNPQLRDEYAQVKLDLAAKGTNIIDYIEAKGSIIQKILAASGMLSLEELAALAKANEKGEKWGAVRTERLLLREFHTPDTQPYYALESSEENARYQSWEPRTLEQARELVAQNMRNLTEIPRTKWELAVEFEGKMIGRVGASLKLDGEVRHFDVWFSFLPEVQGRGFATEAVAKMIEELIKRYKEYDIELEIECDPRNTGSWRLAERLGFEKQSLTEKAWESKGEWVDSLVYRKVITRV